MTDISPGNIIGLDVGGSHVSANTLMNIPRDTIHYTLESHSSATSIINTISTAIERLLPQATGPVTVGIAMPGPFNYTKGISEIYGVGGKFSATFGLHMAETLKTVTRLPPGSGIHFFNDAHCFATGAHHLLKQQSKRSIYITLGTGFGSAFLLNGQLLHQHGNIPASGAFYPEPFKAGIADDYFSTRWLLNEYKTFTGENIPSVKMLAATGQSGEHIFKTFGENMADFLAPWLKKYDCDTLVLGGNISKAWHLFRETFTGNLTAHNCDTEIVICDDTEHCIITGAALLAKEKMTSTNHWHYTNNKMITSDAFRKTSQPLLPLRHANTNGDYNIFPSFHLSTGAIETGFDSLAKQIANEKTVVIDGFGGVLWDEFRTRFNAALIAQGIQPFWYDITACLKPEAKICEMIGESLNGNDPVFGKRFTGSLGDFFDPEKLALLQPDTTADMCIIYGSGAALSNWKGPLIYLDVPKNEIQYRMRAKSIFNLAATQAEENTQMYKRFYFVDWPVLNKHKQALLKQISIIADEQRVQDISWMSGNDFRNSLEEMLSQPFRARPWFEAGIWGGSWMKEKLTNISQTEVNYAWSFELITPENGIVFSHNNILLEVSFDFLLFYNNEKLLGKAAERFGTDFPIRFDFLDTFDGGNLSVQCHPRTGYIREKFGEKFTQDETYYILDSKPDAKVYLGFQENIDPGKFKQALTDAQEKGITIHAEDYVQSFPAHQHDLFLIPNGTIHASGKNSLVLEISSTPYIFTFKMYDWQRLDLSGKPRPINIEHAFNNLYFDRKGDEVAKTLISQPKLLTEGNNYKRYALPTHEAHFYTIERYEFTGEITINTYHQCHICMLVAGDAVNVTADNYTQRFNYAETFVVPAAVNSYKVKNSSPDKAMLVIAFVKEDCC